MRRRTAAAMIIGDEVLSGKTLDTNSNYLAKSLFDFGIDLQRISVIPDNEHEIIDTARQLSSRFDYVFTSGGIGPTHDDVTYRSLAKAFNDHLTLHGETLVRMADYSPNMVTCIPAPEINTYDKQAYTLKQNGKELVTTNQARLRMVQLPSKGIIKYTPNLWVPLVIINSNVHILPGIPKLFSQMLDHYLPSLIEHQQKSPFYRKYIGTKLPEGDIVDSLSEIQSSCLAQEIKIGSYPTYGDVNKPDNARVVVTVVGKDLDAVEQVVKIVSDKIDGWPCSAGKR